MSALALYTGLALAITWPLALHATSHITLANIAAFGDPWAVGWALAYVSRALVGLPHGGIYHPAPHALYYGEAAFGALPLFIGPYLLTGNPILGVNVVFLGGVVLTAWSLHAVTVRWTGSRVAGFLAAWTFLACPFSIWAWGPSAVNYVTLWYWPWIVLGAASPLRTRAATLGLGVLVFLQGLSSAYVAVAVLVPLLALATLRLARRESRRAGGQLLVAAALALAGWAFVFAPYLVVRLDNPELARQTLYPFFPQLAGASRLFAAGEPSGVAPAALAMIALGGLLALAGQGGHGAAWRNCLVWAVVGLVLSLPPRVVVAGHTLASPTGWLADAGIPLHAVRDNGRRGLAALIGLPLLVGVAYAGSAEWLRRRGQRAGGAAAAGLALVLAAGIFHGLLRPVERRASPVPTPGRYPLLAVRASRRVDSPLMAVLGQPGGPLLELPTAPGPIPHADAMLRAQYHGRAILNGFQGYWPAGFPAWMALACRLPEAEAVAGLKRGTGLELVLVHLRPIPFGRPTGPYACPPQAAGEDDAHAAWDPRAWEEVARGGRSDLTLVARDGDDLLFRVGP